MKSKVMVQRADRRLEEDELEVPAIGADGALLRVEACGLCGSDVEQFQGAFGDAVRYPVIPGHEPVGVIEEIGAEAAERWNVRRGDRIALVPMLSCGRCALCIGGRHHHCKEMFREVSGGFGAGYGFISVDFQHGLWGGYSEYMVLHPQTLFCKVPDSIDPRLSTLYQPLASGMHWAVTLPETKYGESVLILGAGQRGLAAIVALRAAGAGQIIVTGIERDAYKLALATRLGATHTIVADREDVVEAVMRLTDRRGVDVAVDTVPIRGEVVNDAIGCVRLGGRIVLAGLKGTGSSVPIDTDRLITRSITMLGALSQPLSAYERGMELLASDLQNLSVLHTHEYPLEDAVEALNVLGGGRPAEEPVSVTLNPAL